MSLFVVLIVFGVIAVVIASIVGLRRMMHEDDIEPGGWNNQAEDDEQKPSGD